MNVFCYSPLFIFQWLSVTFYPSLTILYLPSDASILTLSDLGSEIATSPKGGAKRQPLEINKGALLYPMLQKVILKPIKMMITCKKLGPYLKNSGRY